MIQIDFNKYNLDYLAPDKVEVSEVRVRKFQQNDLSFTEGKLNLDKVYRAMHDWMALADMRKRRRRVRKYIRGDQWHEMVQDPEDPEKTISEEKLIKSRGKLALKQNLMAPIQKNLLGQFRSNKTRTMVVPRNKEDAKMSEMLTNALMAAQDLNHTRELDVNNLRELLMSGVVVCKQRYTMWRERDREDLYQQNVSPNRIFFNTNTRDIRGYDITRIGEIVD